MTESISSKDDVPPNARPWKYTQILAAGAATMGAFCLGTGLGWSSPAIPDLEQASSRIRINKDQGSWIGALLSLGCLIASFVSGYLIEKFGRKMTMVFVAAPFVMCWLLITYAVNVTMLYVSRILLGSFAGMFSVASVVYIGEVVHPSIRGILSACYQLMLTIGILFSYVLGSVVSWEWLSVICGFMPLLMAMCMMFMPESPLFCLKKGREVEAKQALRFLTPDWYPVDDEIDELRQNIQEISAQQGSWRDFLEPPVYKPFLISMGLMLFQQLCGITPITFFIVPIFQAANTGLSSNMQSIIVGVVQVIITAVSALLVDRAGRRILLVISAVGMAISSAALGAYYFMSDNGDDVSSLGWLPLVSLILFIILCSLGFSPIPWLMMGELFPTKVKGLAGSAAASFNWLLSFTIAKLFQNLTDAIGNGPTFWLFTGVNVLGAIFVVIFVPETKGKSLQEIELYFQNSGRDSPTRDELVADADASVNVCVDETVPT